MTASVASGLRLRPAELEDVQFLVELRNRLAPHFLSSEPATAERTAELLADSHTYVLEVDGRAVGSFALYRQHGDRLEFGRFMLEPRASGNGFGRVMLEFAVQEARRLGAHRLRLVTKPQNVAAWWLYEAMGFQVTHVRMELLLD